MGSCAMADSRGVRSDPEALSDDPRDLGPEPAFPPDADAEAGRYWY